MNEIFSKDENFTRDFANNCWQGTCYDKGVNQALKVLCEAIGETNAELPDWNRVIKLRHAIASAVGSLTAIDKSGKGW